MAVSINKVYQKVLALANKEQRGYITPQEFNLFADHAQQDIFEQYFYDLEQRQRGVGSENSYEIISNIEEKISSFEEHDDTIFGSSNPGVFNVSSQIPNIYRLGCVRIKRSGDLYRTAEKTNLKELSKYLNSPLAAPTSATPIYTEYSSNNVPLKIKIYPAPISSDNVKVDYVRKPSTPNWTYIISSTGNALFNSNQYTRDFDLHTSEESNLVIKILQYAGIAIKDFTLVQAAAQNEISGIQQEKS